MVTIPKNAINGSTNSQLMIFVTMLNKKRLNKDNNKQLLNKDIKH